MRDHRPARTRFQAARQGVGVGQANVVAAVASLDAAIAGKVRAEQDLVRLRGIIAEVPFVDVLTTMLDDTIPLTTAEFDEWGDPKNREYYDYMLSYSPYDNVKEQGYPNLMVTTGLHDSQVQYFEPAKWVVKLREYRTDDNRLIMKTNMDAGHGGASGRYRAYEEVAEEYAFLVDLAGIEH